MTQNNAIVVLGLLFCGLLLCIRVAKPTTETDYRKALIANAQANFQDRQLLRAKQLDRILAQRAIR